MAFCQAASEPPTLFAQSQLRLCQLTTSAIIQKGGKGPESRKFVCSFKIAATTRPTLPSSPPVPMCACVECASQQELTHLGCSPCSRPSAVSKNRLEGPCRKLRCSRLPPSGEGRLAGLGCSNHSVFSTLVQTKPCAMCQQIPATTYHDDPMKFLNGLKVVTMASLMTDQCIDSIGQDWISQADTESEEASVLKAWG